MNAEQYIDAMARWWRSLPEGGIPVPGSPDSDDHPFVGYYPLQFYHQSIAAVQHQTSEQQARFFPCVVWAIESHNRISTMDSDLRNLSGTVTINFEIRAKRDEINTESNSYQRTIRDQILQIMSKDKAIIDVELDYDGTDDDLANLLDFTCRIIEVSMPNRGLVFGREIPYRAT